MPPQLDQIKRLTISRPDEQEKALVWNRRKLGLIVVASLVILICFFAWRGIVAPPAIEVETVRANAEFQNSSGMVLAAAGYIVAHHRIDVNSKVTGRVAWIGVEKGDEVKQGQVLVRLEDDEFRAQVKQAQGEVASAKARLEASLAGSRAEEIQRDLSNLQEAEATLSNDKDQFNRSQALYAQGLISTQQLEEIKARYSASQHRVAALRQTYELSLRGPRKEDIDQARGVLEQAEGKLAFSLSQLEATQIRAPSNGTILERTAEKGELITAQFATALDSGGPRGSVVALADLRDLQVAVDISQDDFARITNVQRAEVTTDAYPNRRYNATVAQISPEADRQKATVQVRVKILDPDELLKPDMNANVNFLAEGKISSNDGEIEVPFSAVISRNNSRAVFVAKGDRAVERPVRPIGKKTTGYLVDGVNSGDMVIIDPPPDLKSGSRVKIKGH